MQLYSHPESGNSYKVRLLLAFLGVDYTCIDVDLMTDAQHPMERCGQFLVQRSISLFA